MEQLSLFSLEPKIVRATELLKSFEKTALSMSPNGYYLAFSGGKDSQVIYGLAKMAGVKFEAHYHLTTVDPPELVQFIRKEYPDVVISHPEKSMWQLIRERGFPPTRKIRYCCSDLKEQGGRGKFVITGVRWEESKRRQETRGEVEIVRPKAPLILLNNDNDKRRRMLESCAISGKRILNPIIDWKDEDVWYFINHKVGVHCSLYDCGFSRLGCIGCPLASIKKRKMELERYPKYDAAYLKAFERMLLERKKSKITEDAIWETPEDVYRWWLYGPDKKEKQMEGQLKLEWEEDMSLSA